MSNHAKFVVLADRLISKHGRVVTFKRINSTPADATKPWKGTSSPSISIGPLKAAFVPFRGFEFGSVFEDSELFKEVQEICLVSASGGDLETCHLVTDNGADYKIEWVQRLCPGDQKILYAIGINR